MGLECHYILFLMNTSTINALVDVVCALIVHVWALLQRGVCKLRVILLV